jgi:hypothetical protein
VLNLTLDADSYEEALEADQHVWEDVEQGDWYWIPETPLLAVHCRGATGNGTSSQCSLDQRGHGTGTTSSVLTENPNASLAFVDDGSSTRDFEERGIPVDVYSVSWGHIAPIPGTGSACLKNDGPVAEKNVFPLYVKASGNAPGASSLSDCWSGHPRAVTVGGAYAEDDSRELLAYKESNVVSYFLRPTAMHQSLTEMRDSYCGTSFAAPTVAGALSKIVAEVRAPRT